MNIFTVYFFVVRKILFFQGLGGGGVVCVLSSCLTLLLLLLETEGLLHKLLLRKQYAVYQVPGKIGTALAHQP